VPVLLRDRGCTVAAFHPELTDDNRLHEMFLDSITAAS
jgi:glutamine amidotransferase PdxT